MKGLDGHRGPMRDKEGSLQRATDLDGHHPGSFAQDIPLLKTTPITAQLEP